MHKGIAAVITVETRDQGYGTTLPSGLQGVPYQKALYLGHCQELTSDLRLQTGASLRPMSWPP